MGNSISNSTLIPSSLPSCNNKDGNFCAEVCFLYQRRQEMQAMVDKLDDSTNVLLPLLKMMTIMTKIKHHQNHVV
jgi:hypothetical protein